MPIVNASITLYSLESKDTSLIATSESVPLTTVGEIIMEGNLLNST
ncbi:MAG: hypothetical protein PVI90_12085 [Desulfobacteraceae bacterium]